MVRVVVVGHGAKVRASRIVTRFAARNLKKRPVALTKPAAGSPCAGPHSLPAKTRSADTHSSTPAPHCNTSASRGSKYSLTISTFRSDVRSAIVPMGAAIGRDPANDRCFSDACLCRVQGRGTFAIDHLRSVAEYLLRHDTCTIAVTAILELRLSPTTRTSGQSSACTWQTRSARGLHWPSIPHKATLFPSVPH